MTGVLGRFVSLEMALLGLCELALSFLVIYGMLPGPDLLPGSAGQVAVGSGVLNNANLDLAAILACTVVIIAAAIGLYRPEICIERRRLLMNTVVAGLLAFPAVLVVTGSYRIGLSSHEMLWLSKILLVWLVCMVASRMIFTRVMRERWFVRRILVIGGSEVRLARLRRWTATGRGLLYEPVFAEPQVAGPGVGGGGLTLDGLRRQRIWGIVVAETPGAIDPPQPARFLLDCKLRGVPVLSEAGFCEQHLGRIDLDARLCRHCCSPTASPTRGCQMRPSACWTSAVSLVLLLLTLPLMVITAALVRLDSAGPVLYRQTRVGLHGETFTLFKFRSMAIDAEAGGAPRWATQQDPRITRVGNYHPPDADRRVAATDQRAARRDEPHRPPARTAAVR